MSETSVSTTKDLWDTDRGGSAQLHVVGWMPDGYWDDIPELQRRLAKQKPPNPEWRADVSYPLATDTSAGVEPTVIPPGWNTDRSFNWVKELEGWDLDDDMPTAERMSVMLAQKPPNIEWMASTQAPVAPGVVVGEKSYWTTVDPEKMSAKQRFAHEKRLARQDQFLALIGQGTTATEAARKIGVDPGTIASWRRRYPEFDHRLDRAKAGLSDRTETDDSFVSRRLYYFGYETYEHHQRIVDAIENTPPGGVTMILLPPEAGKTTLLEDWCSDAIAQDPNTRILYVSEAAEGHSPAAKVLGTIKERMVDPERTDPDAQHAQHLPAWNARFGPFHDAKLDKGKPWNAKYIKVSQASGRRDYTFQATSWRSKVYGTRTNWLIFDDVASLASIGETEKLLANIRLTFFSRPGQEGRTVFIGTRVGVGDVYERLIEELPEDILTVVQIPAMDSNGNSYCPEMWPIPALERKRKLVGEDVWACAYMMAPHEASATTFDEEMLNRARKPELTYGFLHQTPASTVLAGIDPALGGGNAVIVAETTGSSLSIVALQVDYHLGRNEKILGILRDMCRYGYSELVVEANSQQRGLARDERLKEMGQQFGFRITEHETGVNKWEYAWGVSAMASSFISGELRFPDGTDKCRRQLEPLRAELLAWRPDVPTKLLRQDMVMALWFIWVVWKQRQRRMKTAKNRWATGGTPWKPGDMSGSWQKRSPGGLVLR